MTDKELIQAVLSTSVETGSLLCLGCGHEHGCGIHGCAILRQAGARLESLCAEIADLRAQLAEKDNLLKAAVNDVCARCKPDDIADGLTFYACEECRWRGAHAGEVDHGN